MKTKIIVVIGVLFVLLVSLVIISARRNQDFFSTFCESIGYNAIIGVQSGDIYDVLARDLFDCKEVREFLETESLILSLLNGDIDIALVGSGYAKQIQNSNIYTNLEYIDVPKDIFIRDAARVFHTEELRDKYNEWLKINISNGNLEKINERWRMKGLPEQKDIPTFHFNGNNGVLVVCDAGNYPPEIYLDANNNPAGLNVEIISLFAQFLGMVPEYFLIPYEDIIDAVKSGKADMSSCTIAITEERQKELILGEPSIFTQAVAIVKKM